MTFESSTGELGEAGEHLEKAAEEDAAEWKQEHPDQKEHEALIAKLREEVEAETQVISTEPAATGDWK